MTETEHMLLETLKHLHRDCLMVEFNKLSDSYVIADSLIKAFESVPQCITIPHRGYVR